MEDKKPSVLEIGGLRVEPTAEPREVFRRLMQWARAAVEAVRNEASESGAVAVVGRVRGEGPGASFGRVVETLDKECPLTLQSPFEGSDAIAGGAWRNRSFGLRGDDGLARLRFSDGVCDLPLHAHEQSDRFIVVDRGRGLFHVSSEQVRGFQGSVRSIPIRERDVLVFLRGTLHTFSAPLGNMELLSFQLPFIPFHEPRQYTVPSTRWFPKALPVVQTIRCDPAWNVMARQPRCP